MDETVCLSQCVTEELIEEEELFPDDALSNHHTDMVDNEPVMNEAKKSFMRYWKCLKSEKGKSH